jgi:hypothetical protein
MTRTRKVILGVAAALVIVGLAVLSIGVWWASSLYQSEPADQTRADAEFAEIRARFAGIDPAFQIRERRLVVARQPVAVTSPVTPAAVHMLVWQPRERMLSRVTLPLWTSKIATEPLPLEALAGIGERGLGAILEAQRRGSELNIRISDLERYGPTLLLDGTTPDGKQVMMWNQ